MQKLNSFSVILKVLSSNDSIKEFISVIQGEDDIKICYPLKFEISPNKIDAGTRWITLSLKNIVTKNLTNLDVRLYSRDSYSVTPLKMSEYIFKSQPNEQRLIQYHSKCQ